MKKIASLMLILALSAGLNAQDKPVVKETEREQMNPDKRATKILGEMKEQLKLDQNQLEKLKPIYVECFTSMKESRKKYKENPQCLRKARFQSRRTIEEKMKVVLRPDQLTKYEEIKKQKQVERKKKMEEKLSEPLDC